MANQSLTQLSVTGTKEESGCEPLRGPSIVLGYARCATLGSPFLRRGFACFLRWHLAASTISASIVSALGYAGVSRAPAGFPTAECGGCLFQKSYSLTGVGSREASGCIGKRRPVCTSACLFVTESMDTWHRKGACCHCCDRGL